MNEKLVDGLRDLADFLEGYELPDGCRLAVGDFYLFADSKAAFVEAARTFGTAAKGVNGSYFNLRKPFGPVALELTIQRHEICQRVKVGERVVPATPERVLPAEPEKVEEVYEWKCPESLLRPEADEKAIAASVAAVGF